MSVISPKQTKPRTKRPYNTYPREGTEELWHLIAGHLGSAASSHVTHPERRNQMHGLLNLLDDNKCVGISSTITAY